MTFLKVNGDHSTPSFSGCVSNASWDGRKSKTVHLTMSPAQAAALLCDDATWSILVQEDGTKTKYDNSNGTMSVKKGSPTDLELAYELLYGEGEIE